jgi:hypothetical protein
MHTWRGRGHLMYPLKDFLKLGRKNAINTKIEGPHPPIFSPNPKYPLKRI